jgi:hypothetical protein
MVSSLAETPEDYLRELPVERAGELSVVRDLVNAHVPEGIVEVMDFGMIAWVVPLEIVPRTYNKKPLMYAALAAQRNHSSLYLMPLYSGSTLDVADFRARWSGGRPLTLGKSCIKFRTASDLDAALIGEGLDSCTLDRFVAASARNHPRTGTLVG